MEQHDRRTAKDKHNAKATEASGFTDPQAFFLSGGSRHGQAVRLPDRRKGVSDAA